METTRNDCPVGICNPRRCFFGVLGRQNAKKTPPRITDEPAFARRHSLIPSLYHNLALVKKKCADSEKTTSIDPKRVEPQPFASSPIGDDAQPKVNPDIRT